MPNIRTTSRPGVPVAQSGAAKNILFSGQASDDATSHHVEVVLAPRVFWQSGLQGTDAFEFDFSPNAIDWTPLVLQSFAVRLNAENTAVVLSVPGFYRLRFEGLTPGVAKALTWELQSTDSVLAQFPPYPPNGNFAEQLLIDGGLADQVLRKVTGNDYDVEWTPSLVNFTERLNSDPPNDVVPVALFVPSSPEANVDVALVPKGLGGFLAAVPDDTPTGGLRRGAHAVDLQTSRVSESQVAAGDFSTIGGGHANRAGGGQAVVCGGIDNYAVGDDAFVGGGRQNYANSNGSTAVGGLNNQISGTFGFIGGGSANVVTGNHGAVLAGEANNNDGDFSVAAGQGHNIQNNHGGALSGYNHQILADFSVVAGGNGNTTQGDGAGVLAGTQNIATTANSGIVAGEDNTTTGVRAGVLAGHDNTPAAEDAVVGGGAFNHADGIRSFVGAGNVNYAIGTNSAVVAGQNNQVSNEGGFIGGGRENQVAANYGTIAGGYGGYCGIIGGFVQSAQPRNFSGDSQLGEYLFSGYTTDATPTSLFADRSGAVSPSQDNVLKLWGPNRRSIAFDGLLVARGTGNTKVAAIRFSGFVSSEGPGSTITVSGVTITNIHNPDALVLAFTAVDSGGNLGYMDIQVTGLAATNLSWVCRVRTVEAFEV